MIMESLPQFILQLVNSAMMINVYRNKLGLTLDVSSGISIATSAVSITNGLYRYIYLKFYKGNSFTHHISIFLSH